MISSDLSVPTPNDMPDNLISAPTTLRIVPAKFMAKPSGVTSAIMSVKNSNTTKQSYFDVPSVSLLVVLIPSYIVGLVTVILVEHSKKEQ